MSRLTPEVATWAVLGILLSSSGAHAERWGTDSGQHALPACPKGKGVAWHNCRGSVTLPDGVEYVGDFQHDRPDGFGIYDDHGSEVQGIYTWRAGSAHLGLGDSSRGGGQVDIGLPDGAEYIGEFKNGLPNGEGTLITAKGDKYTGSFVAGMPNGQGADIRRNRETYVGQWRSGKRSGHGTLTYANGDEYAGEFASDAPSGQGVTTSQSNKDYADGSDAGGTDQSNKPKASSGSANSARRLPLVPQIELVPDAPAPSAAQTDPKKSPGKTNILALIFIAVLVIGGGGFVAYRKFTTA